MQMSRRSQNCWIPFVHLNEMEVVPGKQKGAIDV